MSIQAAFGKLRGMPIGLSEAFVAEGTDSLRRAFPDAVAKPLPTALQASGFLV